MLIIPMIPYRGCIVNQRSDKLRCKRSCGKTTKRGFKRERRRKKIRIFKVGLRRQNVRLELNCWNGNNLERNVKLAFLKSRIFLLLRIYKLFLFINLCVVAKFQKDTWRNSKENMWYRNFSRCLKSKSDNQSSFNVK